MGFKDALAALAAINISTRSRLSNTTIILSNSQGTQILLVVGKIHIVWLIRLPPIRWIMHRHELVTMRSPSHRSNRYPLNYCTHRQEIPTTLCSPSRRSSKPISRLLETTFSHLLPAPLIASKILLDLDHSNPLFADLTSPTNRQRPLPYSSPHFPTPIPTHNPTESQLKNQNTKNNKWKKA